MHEFYQCYASTDANLKMFDIGSGPAIAYTISAAPHAAEIILSEYTEANCAALLQWVNNNPKAYDWTHAFKHVVVDLEGKTAVGSTNTSWVGAQCHQSCCIMWGQQ